MVEEKMISVVTVFLILLVFPLTSTLLSPAVTIFMYIDHLMH